MEEESEKMSAPEDIKKEGIAVEMNYPFSLKVVIGEDLSGDRSVAGDETTKQFIGSEIEPKKIGEYIEEYQGNGSSSGEHYYIIVQKGEAILIKTTITENTYGYQTQTVEYSWEAFELPGITKERLLDMGVNN